MTCMILTALILLSVSTPEATRHITNEFSSTSLNSDDGICKSMVETQGYNCEEHKVTTQDGYILSMQRIPSGRRSGKQGDKPPVPVLLQHGLLSDAVTWLFNNPDESLGFILADNGYDVWLSSTRGTKYSQGHTSLTPNDKAYWNWSWDELAAHDLPSSVQYVYEQTGQKLHYVGHSLGTLIVLASLSQQKLLNMLRSAALLCPIAHLDQITSQPMKLAADSFVSEDLYWLGLKEFVPGEPAVAKLVEDICDAIKGLNCSNLLNIFTGPNCCINNSRIDVYLEHEPQPTATKNMIHLAQMIRNGTVAMYDYGSQAQNMAQYGQPNPPTYDMTRIPNDIPLFLGYGGQDMLADPKDVQVLLDDLKDHDSDKLVVLYREDYAHADFIMGVTAKEVVYNPMMAFFNLN